jgi:ADP-heptose:LPS heptosyltransferase
MDVELGAPRLMLSPEDHAAAENWLAEAGLKRPVILHPGSRGSAQNWPPLRYVELGRELRKRFGCELMLSAGPGEEGMAAELGKELGCPALLHPMPLRAYAALCGKARLFVSASTGPMHLAAALGAPTLSLFPPIRAMSPLRWGPLGNRHAVLSPAGLGQRMPDNGLNYVERIGVDEAADAAAFLLRDAHA